MFRMLRYLGGALQSWWRQDCLAESPYATPRHKDWPELRQKHIRKEPRCRACGRSAPLAVHHILPVFCFPDRELDEGNLITLCDRCHLFIGHLDNWRSWNYSCRFDAMIWFEKKSDRPGVF